MDGPAPRAPRQPRTAILRDPRSKCRLVVKEHLVELVMQALLDVSRKQHVELPQTPEFAIDRTRQREHGDFATNAALVLCKQLGICLLYTSDAADE